MAGARTQGFAVGYSPGYGVVSLLADQGRHDGARHLYNGSSGTFLPVKEADSHGNSEV
jgi:hypothetical protein